MSPSLSILIVEKSGTLKSLSVKDYDEAELYKKCGFKKADGFDKQNEWTVKINGTKYLVSMYAKADGKAGSENKYDFPPPVDTKLFFGSCALVAMQKTDDGAKHVNLSVELWEQIYEKLFGGFEDLTLNAMEDENEEDELENVPTSKKTKNGGYLKDGFVVDDDDEDDEGGHVVTDEDSDKVSTEISDETEDIIDLNDAGSELSEESYDE
jgi:hypothetical protein